jgi:hypothetical protein
MAKGEIPIVKSVGGVNDNFLDLIISIIGRFSNFESWHLEPNNAIIVKAMQIVHIYKNSIYI